MILGFIGTGNITSDVIAGISNSKINYKKIIISPRNKKKAEYFSVIFQNTKDFSDHTVMYFDENGLFMQGMNNSHVCLYELNIPSEWFHQYNYTSSSEKLLQISRI